MKKLYKIAPVFEARLWGGQAIREKFGYVTDLPNIAEVYNVVALPGHLDNEVETTDLTLSEFFAAYPELFDCDWDRVPVETCMAYAEQTLSVQVHPDDEYGLTHDGMRGRPEGVVVIDGLEDNRVLIGHHAQTREQFEEWANAQEWDRLSRYINLRKDDFVNIPAGTLHAFGADSIAVAFSPNSDITYRLYDFDRIDPATGRTRDLHVQQVFDTVTVPDDQVVAVTPMPVDENGCEVTLYHDDPGSYTAGRVRTSGRGTFTRPEFVFFTCVAGSGRIDDMPIAAGETVFVPAHYDAVTIEGDLDLMYVSYKNAEL
ncbi:class I mannose-6-phosphate isomerase [Microbacterium sp.]|uniref:class I mannose-6-phosphate isomerase n=1 Tax=Microbacterium sp. TaxID=51671 RepID=UPI0039E5E368